MKTYKIVWSGKAIIDLQNIHKFIRKDSPKAAKKVMQEIVNLAQTLKVLPERYAIEPYLADELITYRFVVKWNFKLIYVVEETEVLIVKIFDTRQSPEKIEVE